MIDILTLNQVGTCGQYTVAVYMGHVVLYERGEPKTSFSCQEAIEVAYLIAQGAAMLQEHSKEQMDRVKALPDISPLGSLTH